MKAQWFIHHDNVVHGPFTTNQVNERIAAGTFGADCLVWARGSNEWLSISHWTELSSKIEESSKAVNLRIWYCDSGAGQPAGPLTQNELVEHLKGLSRWDAVTLWGTGLLRWLPLFEVPEVMDLVGISRRENPRAPLLGQIALTQIGGSLPSQILQMLTVSVGGFGVKNASFLSRGDRVQVSIKSQDLPAVVQATGEVLYVSRTGDAGIKFIDLASDSKSIIIEHVRRFHDDAAAAA